MSMFGPSLWSMFGWNTVATKTRYPATGTFDVSSFSHLAGCVGLGPDQTNHCRGALIAYWTSDPEGTHIVGVWGQQLTSLIVSNNILRIPNEGPYLYFTFEPFFGQCQMTVNLFGTNAAHWQSSIPGDTILIDDADPMTICTVPPNTVHTTYPCDYFAGDVGIYFDAPAGVQAWVGGFDYLDQMWILDKFPGAGRYRSIVPVGAWFMSIYNTTTATIKYALTVTPKVG
jgi:hypothetical protein